MEDDTKLPQIFWKSVTEAGFLAGICLLGFNAAGFDDLSSFKDYLIILSVFALTVFNIRLYRQSKGKKPNIEYVFGAEQTVKWLTQQIKDAKKSIWVTRFSNAALKDIKDKDDSFEESDYFKETNRRIKGEKCKQIYSYRRIMKLDTKYKIKFAISLIEDHWQQENFFLKGTEMFLPFDLVLIDDKNAILLFHNRDNTRAISGGIKFTNEKVVLRFIEIYNSIWDNVNVQTDIIKEGSLSSEDQEKIWNKIISKVKRLTKEGSLSREDQEEIMNKLTSKLRRIKQEASQERDF